MSFPFKMSLNTRKYHMYEHGHVCWVSLLWNRYYRPQTTKYRRWPFFFSCCIRFACVWISVCLRVQMNSQMKSNRNRQASSNNNNERVTRKQKKTKRKTKSATTTAIAVVVTNRQYCTCVWLALRILFFSLLCCALFFLYMPLLF